MKMRVTFVAALAAWLVFSTQIACAESLVEQVVDTRLVLAFRVDAAELEKVIPGPWTITGIAAGPAKDANFNVIFYDRMLQQDGAGALMGPPYRFVVFAPVVTPKEASATALVASRIYAGDSTRVPGPYKTSQFATVERHSTMESGSEPNTVEETWEVRTPSNHSIKSESEVREKRASETKS